jgi:hypothetical protein
MHGHPTLGVKNAKPRLSSKPGPQIGKLSEEYLTIRNRQMRAKALMAETEGAARRGELISLRLVRLQTSYLLTVMRQQLLAAPGAWCNRMLNLTEAHAARELLKEMVLEELMHLPEKVTDPNWLESLDESEKPMKPGADASPRAKGKSRKPPSPHPAEPGRRKQRASAQDEAARRDSGALLSQGIGGLPADEFNAPGFDLLWREGAQFDQIGLLALCLSGNVAGDLAQRLCVTLKRLGRKDTPCGYGFDVLADRRVDLLAGRIIRPAPVKTQSGDWPGYS